MLLWYVLKCGVELKRRR